MAGGVVLAGEAVEGAAAGLGGAAVLLTALVVEAGETGGVGAVVWGWL